MGRSKKKQTGTRFLCLSAFSSGGFGVMLRYARYRAPDFWIMFPASGFARRYRFSRVLDVAAHAPDNAVTSALPRRGTRPSKSYSRASPGERARSASEDYSARGRNGMGKEYPLVMFREGASPGAVREKSRGLRRRFARGSSLYTYTGISISAQFPNVT